MYDDFLDNDDDNDDVGEKRPLYVIRTLVYTTCDIVYKFRKTKFLSVFLRCRIFLLH